MARRGLVATLAALLSWTAIACTPHTPPRAAPILLFNGAGTSASDAAAVEAILNVNHLDYVTASSWELNGMSAAQLGTYRLLIVPGGNFLKIGRGLTPRTAANIHNAVEGGLNYLGICAGAFFAGHGRYNSLDLTSGVQFHFYSAESRGIRKAALAIAGVGAPPVEHYWEDGPELTGWGAVVGKYPDGTPAIVEGNSGKGWVILSGVHPEAPVDWRRGMTFNTPESVAHAQAATIIDAALHGRRLPHY
jgi:glutamine amidotransferase-like uncharacterized protein